MVLQAAAHGQGVALGNNVLAQPEIEAGRLIAPFDEVLVSKNAFYVVCHDKQADMGRIGDFSRLDVEQEVLLDDNKYLQDGNVGDPIFIFAHGAGVRVRIILSWKPWLVK